MLSDLLMLYKYALQEGSKKDIERALRDLASVGMDKETADLLVNEI